MKIKLSRERCDCDACVENRHNVSVRVADILTSNTKPIDDIDRAMLERRGVVPEGNGELLFEDVSKDELILRISTYQAVLQYYCNVVMKACGKSESRDIVGSQIGTAISIGSEVAADLFVHGSKKPIAH